MKTRLSIFILLALSTGSLLGQLNFSSGDVHSFYFENLESDGAGTQLAPLQLTFFFKEEDFSDLWKFNFSLFDEKESDSPLFVYEEEVPNAGGTPVMVFFISSPGIWSDLDGRIDVSSTMGSFTLEQINIDLFQDSEVYKGSIAIPDPEISIRVEGTELIIEFTGVLQSGTSPNALTDMTPQPSSPYILNLVSSEPSLFFRARK